MNPGLYYAIGKKARGYKLQHIILGFTFNKIVSGISTFTLLRLSYLPISVFWLDLLYQGYAQQQQQQPLKLGYQSFDWSFDFSCEIAEILPGLNTVFRFAVPDSGQAELQYLRDYVGFSAGVGVKASPKSFEPIANISGVIGTDVVALGAEVGIDIPTGILNQFSTSLSLNTSFLIASVTMSDSFDIVKATFYNVLNPATKTAVAAEVKHKISEESTTISIGAQHALLPCTLVKARMNTAGNVSAVLRQQLCQRFYVSVAAEMALNDASNTPRVGLSVALQP